MKKTHWIVSIGLSLAIAVTAIVGFYFWSNSSFESGQDYEAPGLVNRSPADSSANSNVAVEPPKEVSLIAVGDIMLSRTVDDKIKKYQDYKYPFLKTADLSAAADLTFGNLETPVTPGRRIDAYEMVFRSDPEVVEGLNYAGFDVLSLANNHIMNFGTAGLQDTLKYLDEAGIGHTGAGNNKAEARVPVIKEAQGVKFAFLAYSYASAASDAGAGTAPMNIEEMQEDVKTAKEQADFVIVSMHAGAEYVFTPNAQQTSFARSAVDAGAILVIGHHPHVVETMEKYQDGYIFYSLGNFVFDQMWSQETKEGLVAEIIFDQGGILDFRFYPVVIEDYAQPRFANEQESERILGRLDFDLESL